ncbi:hypothetical protein GGTG_05275 [Gaeumannomyces tritici R3-111a-1]|uniref:EthD domain-containing protein n=1 Tax=Gaeumannomyces tritici (strain R3-111a-1) TaxID=644352 RepID=J3NVG0_GAET3|nr:hypothetical protein GGTG_05275 [Gaeumannomyces tritici R3-111a-1]EJT75338.1 hypothetical protein GGTG_05275 [Gaeumannomyces tritici R3-111a-1]
MVYKVMVLAGRKDGITHDYFKSRYEQHMHLMAKLAGDAAPLKHTRWYPKHEGPDDKPVFLAGSPDSMFHDVIAEITCESEEAFGAFVQSLNTDEAKAAIAADEAGFWDRKRQSVVVIGNVEVWEGKEN